jgi:hypothetical protein
MKNMLKFLKIIALVAVVGFSFSACEVEPAGGDITVGSTIGTLTITGLDGFDGNYVAALGEDDEGNKYLAASSVSSDGDVTCGTVVEGSVTLKVWKFISNTELGDFNGSGEIEFHVDIFSVNTVELHNDHYHADNDDDEVASGHADVTFVNGVGEGEFEEGDEDHDHDHDH